MKWLSILGGIKWKLIGAGAVLIALAFVAVYLYGQGRRSGVNEGNKNIAQYQQKVSDLNAKLLSKEIIVRERVINTYHTKTILRTQIEYKNQDVIKTVVPEQYKLSKGWIHAHDQAALGLEIDSKLAANPTPSETSDKSALSVVAKNYDLFNGTADQLEALQQYLKDTGLYHEPK